MIQIFDYSPTMPPKKEGVGVALKSLDDLLAAIEKNELLHQTSSARRDYGFINCISEEEEEDLFALYTTLVQICKVDINALAAACGKGKLADFIEIELKKHGQLKGYFGEWFMKHKQIVQNANSK